MKFRQTLFWDVNPKNIDPQKNAQYIIERIADFGNDNDVRWMVHYYNRKKIRSVISKSRCISPMTRNFWMLMTKKDSGFYPLKRSKSSSKGQ